MGILQMRVVWFAICGGALLGLSGCDENGQFSLANTSAAQVDAESNTAPRATKTVEQDVEAPEVFQSTEAGLWDGRPSLGGVWVAHPDVTDPERVIIRNVDNGKFVVGALFRRERDIPGPRLQISSDAAASLGMLAGAPSSLNVTALRRQEQVVEDPAPVVADEPETPPESEPVVAAVTPAQTNDDDITAAQDTAEADIPASLDIDPDTVTETASTATETVAKPKRGGGFLALFKRKPKAEAETVVAPEDIAAQPIDVQTLDGTELVRNDPAPAPSPAPVRSSLDKPFLQVGIFSVESNAKNTANQMRSAGMVPLIKKGTTSGKDFWRVVVGPARTRAERTTLLKKIKDVGFTDAYAVSR